MAQAGFSVEVERRTLTITGDAASDRLVLRVSPSPPRKLQVDVGDDDATDFQVPLARLDQIQVVAGPGDDAVRMDESFGALTPHAPVTQIEGGDGNDTTVVDGPDAGEQFEISADGDHVRFLRDVGRIELDLVGNRADRCERPRPCRSARGERPIRHRRRRCRGEPSLLGRRRRRRGRRRCPVATAGAAV